jgi:hypothetical protein
MKNIFLFPTDKPSRLHYFTANKAGYYLYPNNGLVIPRNPNCINQNIYITSDEEIKERDYVICDNKLYKIIVTGVLYNDDFTLQTDIEGVFLNPKYCKKIILTTDQDLIKDGVQSIDDEFLEWFVKNPSCEKVGVINTFDYNKKHFVEHSGYKIIIPKEEQDKKLYSEEEVLVKLYECLGHFAQKHNIIINGNEIDQWFEQFKKK